MRQLASLTVWLLAVVVGNARAADWRMDPANSRLEFVATFQQNDVPGVFKEFTTQLRLDADKPETNRLDVEVTVSSADMTSPEINDAIRGPDWFDFSGFSRAEFHATDLRQTGSDQFIAHGVLNLKGVQQPVDVPFTWTVVGDTATMTGQVTVERGTFGIGLGEWVATDVVGAAVTVKFKVTLHKTG